MIYLLRLIDGRQTKELCSLAEFKMCYKSGLECFVISRPDLECGVQKMLKGGRLYNVDTYNDWIVLTKSTKQCIV